MRRLSVALFEREDFGSGSTGSIPGILSGEPYWLEADRSRTKATCEEIQVFQRIAPNLLNRIPILLPVLRGEPTLRLDRLEALGKAYDRFSRLKGGRPSSRLSGADVLSLDPGLSKDITGAVTWDEWGIDLLRLAMLNGRSAASAGAQLFSRTPVEKVVLQSRRVVGLEVKPEGLATAVVRARTVVNTTGPWIPQLVHATGLGLPLRFSKSVYLELDRQVVGFGIACSSEPARRTPRLFAHDHLSYLGPAESAHEGTPESAVPTDRDIDFLLQAGSRYFPGLLQYRMTRVRAGVRPYPVPAENQPPSSHILVDHGRQGAEGFFSLAGGNVAMSRRMAELATDQVCRQLRRREPCRTHLESLPGCVVEMPWLEESQRTGIDPISVKRLMARHGYKAHAILDEAVRDPRLARTLCECEQVLAAEADYCVRKEMAKTVSDLGRRTRLGAGPCRACRCLENAALFLGHRYQWNAERLRAEIASARKELGQSVLPLGEQARQEEYADWLAEGHLRGDHCPPRPPQEAGG
jgi:glycerol-3-phosphate dehydrogenase